MMSERERLIPPLCFVLVCASDCEDGLKSVHLYEGSGQRSASASPGHKRDLSSSSTRPTRYCHTPEA